MHDDLSSFVNPLGLPNLIVSTDTESGDDDEEDFKKPKKPKKKGHKITFSDDDDDFSLSPKPSTSKGLKGSNDSKCSKGKIDSWIYSPFEFQFQFELFLIDKVPKFHINLLNGVFTNFFK